MLEKSVICGKLRSGGYVGYLFNSPETELSTWKWLVSLRTIESAWAEPVSIFRNRFNSKGDAK